MYSRNITSAYCNNNINVGVVYCLLLIKKRNEGQYVYVNYILHISFNLFNEICINNY